jgi:pSer/pThr/pTyr-binding forkhead associated (FHA) protein
MQVQLLVVNKSQIGEVILVNVPIFRIGRAKDCHLRSNSSRISRQHCAIHVQDDVVTILDLGSRTGTFVNGERISSQKELKGGDELTVGGHSFAVSIQTGVEQPATSQDEVFELASDSAVRPTEEPEQDDAVMFDLQYKGKNVSVSKKQLREMARKGNITSDCVITFAGTKVYADTISGIVFGQETPTVASQTNSETQSSEPYAVTASTTLPSCDAAIVDAAFPVDIADEPSVQIARVPGARKDITFSDLGKPLEEPLNRISAWVSDNVTSRHVKIGGSVLAVFCLLGICGAWLWGGTNNHGTVRILGTVMLDDVPIEGVSVTLHPRNENGQATGSTTDRRGNFTVKTRLVVTTGRTPTVKMVNGAMPGEYDVTFKKYDAPYQEISIENSEGVDRLPNYTFHIPQRYGNPDKPSVEPIRVEPSGRNRFTFNLSSAAVPQDVVFPADHNIPLPLQTVAVTDDPVDLTTAVDLEEELRESGFGFNVNGVSSYVQFGTAALRDNLRQAASALDRAEAEVNIRTAQAEIAQKVFYAEYTYSAPDNSARSDGDRIIFTMVIQTEFTASRVDAILFPMPDVTGELGSGRSGIVLAVSGGAESIRELVRENRNYRVKIWFTNLRLAGQSGASTDVLKIEIIKVQ